MQNPKRKDYHYTVNMFSNFGLNRRRNLLAEVGGRTFEAHSLEETIKQCATILFEAECPMSAIFLDALDKNKYVLYRMPDGYEGDEAIGIMKGTGNDFFSMADGQKRFCCYGLMIETADNVWYVCE